jgi:tetratricopeptide (TPR) repeat protein
MAAAKKKTRKELLKEPDEFLTITSKVLGWAATYKKQINIALVAALAVASIVSGVVFYINYQESKAAELLSQALEKLDRLGPGKPTPKAVQDVSEDFKRIFNEYGGRSNANIARLMYADLCYETGDYPQAAELYKTSLQEFTGQPIIHFQILKSLGYTYSALNDLGAAAGYFEQALSGGEKNLQDDLLFNLGAIYSRLGQKEKGSDSFKRILNEHPDSVYANLIRNKVENIN